MAQVLNFTGDRKLQGIRPDFERAIVMLGSCGLYDTNAERFKYLASRVYTGELTPDEAGLIAIILGVKVERFAYDE